MTEPGGDLKVLIEEIAKALVDDPSQVSVQVVDGDEGEGTLLTLTHEQLFDQAARDGHERGWLTGLDKLEKWIA